VIDDLPVDLLGNAIDLHGLRLVNRVEQGGKRIAEIEAATAAMANVEDTLKLLEKRSLVVKLFRLPVKWVPGRRLKTALASSAGQEFLLC
jgi:hypothetical protein